MKYEDFNENSGIDFLIPTKQIKDLKPQICTIIDVSEFKSADGKSYPRMTLQKPDSTKFQVPAWTRDVSLLCKEWGTDSDSWKNNEVEVSIISKKLLIKPTQQKTNEEAV